MRLHHLEVVAFGPFAERVEVDFDALSDAGLFLLTGATGAGKTSVLDAVCFALYGAVPGDRQGAKRLRSDHAAPGVAPSVALELSVAGRRFRVLRSPAWHRPRKRGEGTTREQARVLLSERLDGAWIPRATRLDEAGHLVSELLGMTLTPVLPGPAAAAGQVPGVPASRVRRASPAAAAPVPHLPLRGRRAVAP